MFLSYLLLAVYSLSLLYIGLKDRKTEDKDGFIIADRKVGLLGTMSSIAAGSRDGGGLIFWIGMGFSLVYGLYYLFIGSLIGGIILSYIAPRVREVAKKNNHITISQIVRSEIGNKTEKVTALILIVFSMLLTAAQFYVLGSLLSLLLGVSSYYSIFISTVIIAAYVSMGGYKSIVKTDVLQFFIMLSLWVLIFTLPYNKEDVFNFSSFYQSFSVMDMIAGGMFMVLLWFSLADNWQRIFSTKDAKTAKAGVIGSIFAFFIVTLPITLIGISARSVLPKTTSANDVFVNILNNSAYSKVFISFFTLAVVSMIMSTVDTHTYIFSSTVLENFLKVSIYNNKKRYIRLSKLIMISMLLITSLMSLRIENMIDYILGSYSLIAILGPVFFLSSIGIIKNKSKILDNTFMSLLLICFFIGSFLFFSGYMASFVVRISVPIILLILLLISLCFFKLFKKEKV